MGGVIIFLLVLNMFFGSSFFAEYLAESSYSTNENTIIKLQRDNSIDRNNSKLIIPLSPPDEDPYPPRPPF